MDETNCRSDICCSFHVNYSIAHFIKILFMSPSHFHFCNVTVKCSHDKSSTCAVKRKSDFHRFRTSQNAEKKILFDITFDEYTTCVTKERAVTDRNDTVIFIVGTCTLHHTLLQIYSTTTQ